MRPAQRRESEEAAATERERKARAARTAAAGSRGNAALKPSARLGNGGGGGRLPLRLARLGFVHRLIRNRHHYRHLCCLGLHHALCAGTSWPVVESARRRGPGAGAERERAEGGGHADEARP